jgi:HK97 gp10 family phage protein
MAIKWYAENLVREIKKAKRQSLKKAGQIVVKEARVLCPIGKQSRGVAQSGENAGKAWTERIPGALKKSIRSRVTKSGIKCQVIAGARSSSKTEPYYAWMVEAGTVHSQAKPYLRPALEKSGAAIMALFDQWL